MELSDIRQRELSEKCENEALDSAQKKLHDEFQHALFDGGSGGSMEDEARSAIHEFLPDSDDELTRKGVKEIKNFLETVLTSTEIKVKDVYITLRHPRPKEDKQTVLRVVLPEISFKNSETEVPEPSSTEDTTYFKSVRFTGFRVELFEHSLSNPNDGVTQTVACATSQEPSIVKLRVSVGSHRLSVSTIDLNENKPKNCAPKVDVRSFVKGFRCLMTAKHLVLLLKVLDALRRSTDFVAVHRQKMAVEAEEKAVGVDDDRSGSYENLDEQVSLWNISVQFAQISLALIQDSNSEWPSRWWQSSEPAPQSSDFSMGDDGRLPPGILFNPTISRLSEDHFLFLMKNVHIMSHQTPVDSFVGIDVTEVELFEYLKPLSTSPEVDLNGDKLLVRRMLIFDRERAAQIPTFSSLTASFSAPMTQFSSPDVSFSSTRRISDSKTASIQLDDHVLKTNLNVQPLILDLDLGLPDRLKELWDAFTANISSEDNGRGVSNPPGSPSSLSNKDEYSSGREASPKAITKIEAQKIQFRVSVPSSSRNRSSHNSLSKSNMSLSLGKSISSEKSSSRGVSDGIINYDPRGQMRSEYLLMDITKLEATTETLIDTFGKLNDEDPETWLILCDRGILDLYYEEDGVISAHKIVQSDTAVSKKKGMSDIVYHPQAFITFKNTSKLLADEPITTELPSSGLPNVRIFQSTSEEENELKAQTKFQNESDSDAYGHEFQMFAKRNAPVHIKIELPFTFTNITKEEYDLLMNLYCDVVAFWDRKKPQNSIQMKNSGTDEKHEADDEEGHSPTDGNEFFEDLPPLDLLPPRDDHFGESDDNKDPPSPGVSPGVGSYDDHFTDDSDNEMFYSVVEQIDYDTLNFDDAVLQQTDTKHRLNSADALEEKNDFSGDHRDMKRSFVEAGSILSSVKIILRQGIVDLSETSKEDREKSFDFHSAPRTLRLDVQDLHVSHIVKLENVLQNDENLDDVKSEHPTATTTTTNESPPIKHSKTVAPVTYITLTAGDATLWEFTEVLPRDHSHHSNASDEIPRAQCMPILFRTMLPQGTFGIGQGDVNVLHAFIVMRMKDYVLENEEMDSFLSIFALLDLRALTFQYHVESQWMDKVSDFFTLEHSAPQEKNVTMKDEASVFVHAYDCVVDYNPNGNESRAVFTLGKVKISASIIEETLQFSYKIDVHDGAIFLVNNSKKTEFASLATHTQQEYLEHVEEDYEISDLEICDMNEFDLSGSNLYERESVRKKCKLLEHLPVLSAPFLHHLPGDSVFMNLEPINFVRVADLDYLEAFIKQATHSSHMSLEIKSKCFTIMTCSDSGSTLMKLFDFFSESISGPVKRKDVDMFFPEKKNDELDEKIGDSTLPSLSLDFSRQDSHMSHLSNFSDDYKLDHQFDPMAHFNARNLHSNNMTQSAVSSLAESISFQQNYFPQNSSNIAAGGGAGNSIDILADIDKSMFGAQMSSSMQESIPKLSQDSIVSQFEQPKSSGPLNINIITDHIPEPSENDEIHFTHAEETNFIVNEDSSRSQRRDDNSHLQKMFDHRVAPTNVSQSSSRQSSYPPSPTSSIHSSARHHQKSMTYKEREQNNFWDRDDVVEEDTVVGTWFVPPKIHDSHAGPSKQASPSVSTSSLPQISQISSSSTHHFSQSSQQSHPTANSSSSLGHQMPEFIENYADRVSQDEVGGTYTKKLPSEFPLPLSRIEVECEKLTWRLFGGQDWATAEEILEDEKRTKRQERSLRKRRSSQTDHKTSSTPERIVKKAANQNKPRRHSNHTAHIEYREKENDFNSPTPREQEWKNSPIEVYDLYSQDGNIRSSNRKRSNEEEKGHQHQYFSSVDDDRRRSLTQRDHLLDINHFGDDTDSQSSQHRGGIERGGLDTFITTDIEFEDESPEFSLPYEQKGQKMRRSSVPTTKFGSRRCRKGRRTDEVMELRFIGFELVHHSFEKHETFAGRTVVNVDDAEIIDLIQTSNFKKFACYYRRDDKPRITGSKMFQFSSVSVRADPIRRPETEDLQVSIKLLPIRMNIDQDAVDFIAMYFWGDDDDDTSQEPSTPSSPNPSNNPNPNVVKEEIKQQAIENSPDLPSSTLDSTPPAVVYIQSFRVHGLDICVDYKPKHVDYDSLKSGDLSQLIHMFPLQGVEISLKRFVSPGVQGWGAAFGSLLKFWGEDISSGQAHQYLAGVQPIRSIIKVGSGIADLVLIPIAQYKSDGRILYGVTRGTSSFARTMALEAIQIGNDIAEVSQTLLEGFDTAISSALASTSQRPSDVTRRPRVSRNTRTRRTTRQPKTISEGIHQAYESLCLGVQAAGNGVVAIPLEEYRRAGYKGYISSMLRGVPGAILQPIIGATEALSKALVGVRNQVHPIRRLEIQDKYKSRGRSGLK